MKKALVTGVTGQDGSYLAEFLLLKGYEVHGVVRRASQINTARLDHLYESPDKQNRKLVLHFGDVSDSSRMSKIISDISPDEIYNLAAQSHVRVSFDVPFQTGEVTGLGTTSILEAIRQSGSRAKLYQASSSEMFGSSAPPQDETTSFEPRSPYGAAKLYGHWMTKNYREAYGLFAVSGILFNHESPRRGETFVTRKISRAVAKIKSGLQDSLYLGNLDSERDWGYAPEYIVAMWRMLQQDNPKDYVIGTGKSYSVRAFLDEAFGAVDLDWKNFVEFDERYLRPTEVDRLRANPIAAHQDLGWSAEVSIGQLAREMVRSDLISLSGPVADLPIGQMWRDETT